MLLGISTIFLLPDRPESTTFLTERERKLAIERMNRSTSGDDGAVVQKGNGPQITSVSHWHANQPYISSVHVYAAFRD